MEKMPLPFACMVNSAATLASGGSSSSREHHQPPPPPPTFTPTLVSCRSRLGCKDAPPQVHQEDGRGWLSEELIKVAPEFFTAKQMDYHGPRRRNAGTRTVQPEDHLGGVTSKRPNPSFEAAAAAADDMFMLPDDWSEYKHMSTTPKNVARKVDYQPCAACKIQRRRCSAECPLAPYFPAAEHEQCFMNCRRLYGVNNLIRFVNEADPSERDDTMKSLMFEADQRERDPVHGCFGIICRLKEQQRKLSQDLASTREQLSFLQADQPRRESERRCSEAEKKREEAEKRYRATEKLYDELRLWKIKRLLPSKELSGGPLAQDIFDEEARAKQCPLCLQRFTREGWYTLGSCGHQYHLHCLLLHSASKNHCFVCKVNFPPEFYKTMNTPACEVS